MSVWYSFFFISTWIYIHSEVFGSEIRVFSIEIEGIQTRLAQSIHFILIIHYEVVMSHNNTAVCFSSLRLIPTMRTPSKLMSFEVDVSTIIQRGGEQQILQSRH